MSSASNRCSVCGKRAYETERVLLDGVAFHKFCLKCETCHKTISPTSCTALKGHYYCKPCYIKAFKQKGNYDEGFGREQHKKQWAPSTFGVNNASSEAEPAQASEPAAAEPVAKPAEEHKETAVVVPKEEKPAEHKEEAPAPVVHKEEAPVVRKPEPVAPQAEKSPRMRPKSVVLGRAAAVFQQQEQQREQQRTTHHAAAPALPYKPGEAKAEAPALPSKPGVVEKPVVAAAPAKPAAVATVAKTDSSSRLSVKAAALARFNAMIAESGTDHPSRASVSVHATVSEDKHTAESTTSKDTVKAVETVAAPVQTERKPPARAQSMRLGKASGNLLQRLMVFDPTFKPDAEDLANASLVEVKAN